MKITSSQDLLSKAERSILYEGKEWVRGPLLGSGTYASVHVAYFPSPKTRMFRGFPQVVAVKSNYATLEKELTSERMLLSALRDCPYIIRYLGYDITEASDGRERVVNVFMELASGGTLMDLVIESNYLGLPEQTVRRMTRSVVGGLRWIHELGLIHGDMKLENVLLVKQGNGEFVAKVADLGLARAADETGVTVNGTRGYWAPEVETQNVQGQPADVWALGCVVMGMLTGKFPWEYTAVIATGQLPSLLEGKFSGAAIDFVLKCFQRNPSDRATAEELFHHPFVGGCEYENSSRSDDNQSSTS